MASSTKEALERLWPLTENFEYAAEVGLGLRMADLRAWQAWDSTERRERYVLPQALGFQFLLDQEKEHGKSERLLGLIGEVVRRSDRRLLVELQASLRILDEPGADRETDPLPEARPAQVGVVLPELCLDYPGRARLFGIWLDQALKEVDLVRIPFDPATNRQLARVHTPAYLDGLDRLAAAGGAPLTPETALLPRSPVAVRDAAGSMIAAASESLRGGRPVLAAAAPGSHHAEPSRAGGTCLINNLAVAAEDLLQRPEIRKVAILDLDAHHGNGSEEIFYRRSDVLTVSVHASAPFFPGSGDPEIVGEGPGRGFNMNIEAGADKSWGEAVTIAGHRLEAFSPDLLLIELSTDAHRADPVSPLQAGDDDFRLAGKIVRGLGCPTAVELGASASRRAWVGGIRSFLDGLLD